ncbi:MAG: ribbon-helix-helix protein, CopG family [Chloroflexota bacterium]
MVVRKQHFSMRLSAETIERLTRDAARSGQPKTALAERYLEEGMRMAQHPGVVFRQGPAGRRAGLPGHRLDIWEIIETVRNEDGDLARAAAYLDVAPHLVATALDYYADYPAEIDDWIARNSAIAEEAESSWRRREDIANR